MLSIRRDQSQIMVEKEIITFLPGTSAAVRAYNVKKYEPHYHGECIELLFVLEGNLDLFSSYDRFHMEKTDFTVINRGDVHYINSEEGALVVSLYLNFGWYREIYEYLDHIFFECESFNANSVQLKYNTEIRKLVSGIILEFSEETPDVDRINEKARMLMDIFVNKYDFVHYHNGRELPADQMQRYYRLIKEIDIHYSEKLDIDQLAQQEYIGKNYVSQFWKKATSMNLTDYITSVRSEKSEKMMLTSNKSINEISFSCGFSDPKYIYKGFRKWYGRTPSEHKKLYEKYKQEGSDKQEYSMSEFIGRFGRALVLSNMDEANVSLMKAANAGESWRKKFERQICKFRGSKMKTQMFIESQRESGVCDICIPLFDKDAVTINEGKVDFDTAFIKEVVYAAKEMKHTLCVEVTLSKRTADEWKSLIENFAAAIKTEGMEEVFSKCRFIVYFDEFDKTTEAKEMADKLSEITGCRNVRIALRFD